MDSTLHTIIAAQYIQERMAEAETTRRARDARPGRKGRRRRIWMPRARRTAAALERRSLAPH